MEQPSSPFKIPASPVTPLQQLSPDRINQQRIPASPSLPNQLSNSDLKLPRQSIDVQSKVAFINSLNQAGSPSRQQGSSAHSALQRALLGREEAENALRNSNTQLAEAEVRQRKISERLESFMEELQAVKERQAHERQVFEKEVRKARKDAFRAGSALVKIQEDLKESRAEAKTLRAEAQHERFEKEKSKQEAFERAYTLAGLLEEVEVMREKMRSMEAAREAEVLEEQSRSLQREEDHRLLAELRQQEEQEHASHSPEAQIKQETQEAIETVHIRQNRFERDLSEELPQSESVGRRSVSLGIYQSQQLSPEMRQDPTTDADERLLDLNTELQWEKKLRTRAEEMIHFLQMECQFKICACRVAEKNGKAFIHDKDYVDLIPAEPAERTEEAEEPEFEGNDSCEPAASGMQATDQPEDMFNISRQSRNLEDEAARGKPEISPTKTIPLRSCQVPSPCASELSSLSARTEASQVGLFSLSSVKNASSPAIFSAEDMTYQSPLRTMTRPKSACSIPLRDPPASPLPRSPSQSPYPLTPAFKTPLRPGLRIVHSQTTTTMMVPLRDNDDVFSPARGTPGTPISREAALAQIRARRDRARSVAMSTSRSAPGSARRGLVGGLRDISAPGRF
jgi:hypothetical protein